MSPTQAPWLSAASEGLQNSKKTQYIKYLHWQVWNCPNKIPVGNLGSADCDFAIALASYRWETGPKLEMAEKWLAKCLTPFLWQKIRMSTLRTKHVMFAMNRWLFVVNATLGFFCNLSTACNASSKPNKCGTEICDCTKRIRFRAAPTLSNSNIARDSTCKHSWANNLMRSSVFRRKGRPGPPRIDGPETWKKKLQKIRNDITRVAPKMSVNCELEVQNEGCAEDLVTNLNFFPAKVVRNICYQASTLFTLKMLFKFHHPTLLGLLLHRRQQECLARDCHAELMLWMSWKKHLGLGISNHGSDKNFSEKSPPKNVLKNEIVKISQSKQAINQIPPISFTIHAPVQTGKFAAIVILKFSPTVLAFLFQFWKISFKTNVSSVGFSQSGAKKTQNAHAKRKKSLWPSNPFPCEQKPAPNRKNKNHIAN